MSNLLFTHSCIKNYSDADLFEAVEHDIVIIGQRHFGESFKADSAFQVGYDVEVMCEIIDEIATHFVVKLPVIQIVRKPIYKPDGTRGTAPIIDGLMKFKVADLVNCVARRLQHPEYKWTRLWYGWWQVESE